MPMPTTAKAGGHYLSSLLIAEEASVGYHEGIALNHHGQVAEGSGENIFVIKNNQLITPPTSAAILPGLTRDAVIQLAKSLGYLVLNNLCPRALYLADEIMMTGTAAEIVPVCAVDGYVGQGKVGYITQQLQTAFFGLFKGLTHDAWEWLTPVPMKSTASQPEKSTL